MERLSGLPQITKLASGNSKFEPFAFIACSLHLQVMLSTFCISKSCLFTAFAKVLQFTQFLWVRTEY